MMLRRWSFSSKGGAHPPLSAPERHWRAGAGLAFCAATASTPWLLQAGPSNVCIFKALSGWPCPLCGGTHACAALLAGDWSAAWQANAGALPLLLLIWGLALQWLYEALTGRRLWWAGRWTTMAWHSAWWAAGVFLLLVWLWRLLFQPFS